MSPVRFDSDMYDASTTPFVRYPADLSHLGDLAPPQLVRQPAEPHDPWGIDSEVGYPADHLRTTHDRTLI